MSSEGDGVALSSDSSLLREAKLRVTDAAFLRLLAETLSRIPDDVQPLRSVKSVALKPKGSMQGLVGLTRWRGPRGGGDTGGRQTITFYTDLFNELSDEAKTAVIAHELAHAWLNEHFRPEQSLEREREADELARRWGFGNELAALDAEAETI